MNPMDPLAVLERAITGNPFVVILVVSIAVVLWRRLEQQDVQHAQALDSAIKRSDERYERLHEKTLAAVDRMTEAVKNLQHALEDRR